MKFNSLLMLLMVAMAFAFAVPSHAQAYKTNTFDGVPSASIAASTTTNLTSTAVRLWSGKSGTGQGISIMTTLTGASAVATNAVTLRFNVSLDGSSYTTDTPLSVTATPNGATEATVWTNLSLPNVRYIKLKSITTGANTNVTVNSIKGGFYQD